MKKFLAMALLVLSVGFVASPAKAAAQIKVRIGGRNHRRRHRRVVRRVVRVTPRGRRTVVTRRVVRRP